MKRAGEHETVRQSCKSLFAPDDLLSLWESYFPLPMDFLIGLVIPSNDTTSVLRVFIHVVLFLCIN
jgi:hypothetical protein